MVDFTRFLYLTISYASVNFLLLGDSECFSHETHVTYSCDEVFQEVRDIYSNDLRTRCQCIFLNTSMHAKCRVSRNACLILLGAMERQRIHNLRITNT